MQKRDRAIGLLLGALALSANSAPPLSGLWGAPGARLSLDANGGVLEQDCAHASLPPIRLSKNGRFSVTGSLEAMSGGPQLADGPPSTVPTRFSGRVHDDMMELTIAPKGRASQSLTLTAGRRIKIIRCL